jgi:hypothetical protein
VPYRDFVIEYPPYALPLFLIPHLVYKRDYLFAFMCSVMVADWIMKLVLLRAFGRERTLFSLAAILLAVGCTPFIRYFYLQRYDIFPALTSVAAVLLLAQRRFFWSGILIAIGTGMKLYPALWIPAIMALAFRCARGRQFVTGIALGFLPLAIASFFMPWWQFAEFHAGRGLQVESLYASLLWLAERAQLANVRWETMGAWIELRGPLAQNLLPSCRVAFLAFVALSVAVSFISARRLQWSLDRNMTSEIAQLALLPLLSFVGFNLVFSPQYLVWVLPLAALAATRRDIWILIAICLAVAVTPLFFPSKEYASGLSTAQTVVLVIRNLLIVAVWGKLLHRQWRIFLGDKNEESQNVALPETARP